jgi:ribosomal protein S18 acetylase RimI-like enzyme
VPEIRDATWDDFDEVFALLEARSRAAFGISQQRQEHLREAWTLPRLGRWVAVEGDRIVGYVQLHETPDVAHAAVDADVGDALLAHVEQEARRRGFDHVSVTAVPEDKPLYDAVRRNGYALDREVLRMERALNGDLPQPVWPDDVHVRAYEDADSERVHALLDDSYTGWDRDYVPMSHEGWLAFMTEHAEFDPALWFLVEREGDLVACALHWKENERRGWVKDLVVRESERGRGLGTALLHHGFRAYASRGVDRVGLKVDSTNPTGAPRLYERVGFVIDRRYGLWQKRV